MFKPSGDLRRDYNRLSSEYMKQKDRILSYQEQIASLRNSNKTMEKALAREKECRKEEAAQKDAIIQALMNKVAHLETLADRDGTNTGRFCFQNIECIQRLERDLQKSADNNPSHTWAKNMKKTISTWVKKRKDYQEGGRERFEEREEEKFHVKIKRLIQKGYKESGKSTNPTTVPSEKTLLKRLEKYYDNYFRWISDFTLPTTDNLSERGLQGIKSHMKISGQFENKTAAKNYATVKTYVETCRKNGINEMTALSRLCSGNPYTVDEIFA